MGEAGVAIILRLGKGVECLFIKRRVSPDDPWSGHIAFPGGRKKPVDKNILDTIYREVMEEVGIDLRSSGELIYMLPPEYPGNEPELKVYPYVFKLTAPIDVRLGSEAEKFYWIDLDALVKENVSVSTSMGFRVVEAYTFIKDGEKVVVWGLTKRILDNFFLHRENIMSSI